MDYEECNEQNTPLLRDIEAARLRRDPELRNIAAWIWARDAIDEIFKDGTRD